MAWQNNLFSNLLTVFILFTISLIAYLKFTQQTFGDLIRNIKDFFTEGTPEVYHELQGGFESIK